MKSLDTFSFDQWQANDFITAEPFRSYIDDVKEMLFGLPITAIHTMGCIFNLEDLEGGDGEGDVAGKTFLELDEPIVLDFEGKHLEIWFINTSHAKVGINTLTLKGKSYQPYPWRDVTKYFPKVIGQTLKDISLSGCNEGFYDSVFSGDGDRPDGGDYFDMLTLVFQNDHTIGLYGSYEHMYVAEGSIGDM